MSNLFNIYFLLIYLIFKNKIINNININNKNNFFQKNVNISKRILFNYYFY